MLCTFEIRLMQLSTVCIYEGPRVCKWVRADRGSTGVLIIMMIARLKGNTDWCEPRRFNQL